MLGERDKVKKPFWGKKKKKKHWVLKFQNDSQSLKKKWRRYLEGEGEATSLTRMLVKMELNEGEQVGCPLWIWPCFPELWVLHALARQPQLQLHPMASAQLPSNLPHHHNKLWGYEQRGENGAQNLLQRQSLLPATFLTRRAKDNCQNRDLVGSEPASRKGGSAVAAARGSMRLSSAFRLLEGRWRQCESALELILYGCP